MTAIVAPVDGELTDPAWAQELTAAVNSLLNDVGSLEISNTAILNDLSLLDGRVGDLETSQEKLGCRLRRVAAQTLNDASITTVSWDTEDEDVGGLFAPGTPTVITVPETGLWGVSFAVSAVAPNARSYIELVVTSSLALPATRGNWGSGEDSVGHVAILYLNAGDSFVMSVFRDGAAGTTMGARLSCFRLTGGS